MSSNTPVKRILILATNPEDTTKLRLDKEVREIDNGLRRAKERAQFALEQKWAVRPDDLRRAMLDFEPQIVHFCGHGAGQRGLAFENELGEEQLISTDALANLFKLFASRGVQCVVLNACYSEAQAEAIAQHISYVIGMSKEIGDDAAIKFAVGFYDALGAGWSFEDAYKLGCNAIDLEGIPEHLTPILKKSSEASKKLLPNYAALNSEWITHDKDIFLKSQNLMSERQLLNFLEQLEINHRFLENQVHNIHDFCNFFEEESNRFITEELYHSSDELVEQLNSLSEFTVCNFFFFPETSSDLEGNTRFCMQPEMNIDRNPRHINAEKMLRYDELTEELYSHTTKVRNLYKKYRRLVKELLKI